MSSLKQKVLLSVGEQDQAFLNMAEKLGEVADVTVCGLDGYSLDGYDIFIGKQMSADKLARADSLKAVFAYKTGVDDFPLEEFAKRGIVLSNSHVNSRYIAEYAVGLAVALANRIVEYDRAMRQGDWLLDNPNWQSLFNMKVGLVGFGHIGREINALLVKMGVETYTIDRGKEYNDVKLVSDLSKLCITCDLLILSLPKTSDTDKMFDGNIFRLLSGKYIVNVGRSNCIDEDALYEALTKGGLKGAAIDTWREKARKSTERVLPFDRKFDKLNNIILSSHKAMQARDGHSKYVQDALANVLEYIVSGAVNNKVDLLRGY